MGRIGRAKFGNVAHYTHGFSIVPPNATDEKCDKSQKKYVWLYFALVFINQMD